MVSIGPGDMVPRQFNFPPPIHGFVLFGVLRKRLTNEQRESVNIILNLKCFFNRLIVCLCVLHYKLIADEDRSYIRMFQKYAVLIGLVYRK